MSLNGPGSLADSLLFMFGVALKMPLTGSIDIRI